MRPRALWRLRRREVPGLRPKQIVRRDGDPRVLIESPPAESESASAAGRARGGGGRAGGGHHAHLIKEDRMSVLIDKNTRLIVKGLTGREGTFHAKQAQ